MAQVDQKGGGSARAASSLPKVKLYRELSIQDLERVIRAVSNARAVQLEGDAIEFQFEDKDHDLLTVVVREIDREHVFGLVGFRVPEDKVIGTVLACNKWNSQEDASGTFSAMFQLNDDAFSALLKSDLWLTGGVTESHLEAWARNLIDHINPWEEMIVPAIKDAPPDREIAGTAHGGWWKGLAEEAIREGGPLLRSWLESRRTLSSPTSGA